MSTLLASLGVIAAAVLVVRVALSDPDQPATIRRGTRREPVAKAPTVIDAAPAPAAFEAAPGPTSFEALAPSTVEAAPAPEAFEAAPAPTALQRWPAPSVAPEPLSPPVGVRVPAGRWLRVRSSVVLIILVTFVGILVAFGVGAGLALAFRALRHAVG